MQKYSYPEESHSGTAVQSSILHCTLRSQVSRALYGQDSPFHREESRQVGRVRGQDDQREEPPDPSDYSGGSRL